MSENVSAFGSAIFFISPALLFRHFQFRMKRSLFVGTHAVTTYLSAENCIKLCCSLNPFNMSTIEFFAIQVRRPIEYSIHRATLSNDHVYSCCDLV